MALVVADRVKETTTTTGTGNISLAGAVTGFRAFSAVCANNDTVGYCIDSGGSEWETGIGTWQTGNTLVRTLVLASSNSNAAVSFSSGTKNVFCTPLSEQFAWVADSPKETLLSNVANDYFGGAAFPAETSLDTGGTRGPSAAAWQWRNQDSSTADIQVGGGLLLVPQVNSEHHGIEQATSGTFKYRAECIIRFDASTSGTSEWGVYVCDNSTGKALFGGVAVISGTIGWHSSRWNTLSSFNADLRNPNSGVDPRNYYFWIEVEYDGTNIIFRYSPTGDEGSFSLIVSEAKSSFITNAPTHVGVTAYADSVASALLVKTWKRVA